MSKFEELISLRTDKLFDGAVNVEWFWEQQEKAFHAARNYLFHGPEYHGVSQSDIGSAHGHSLLDTATFLKEIVEHLHSGLGNPFKLAIAGYGTGKSHLALTLANFFSTPQGKIAEEIIENVKNADQKIGNLLKAQATSQPCMVIIINGMNDFDLTEEIFKQIYLNLKKHNIPTQVLDDIRPRFKQAINILTSFDATKIKELIEIFNDHAITHSSKDDIVNALKSQDEKTYKYVHDFLAELGIPIRALGCESLQELLKVVTQEYCGSDKPFRHLLVLFDEFGRYSEFATQRSQIAGSGVLQQLFEGIQSNQENASFIGFIQFELNSYLERIAPEYKNDVTRVITRYQSAEKKYLSVNLETLIAHLIEKDTIINCDHEKTLTKMSLLNNWFPNSNNFSVWNQIDKFKNVIAKGCWPLEPSATWLLYHLTASGQHLQSRSALALLKDNFDNRKNVEFSNNDFIYATDLWSQNLLNELTQAENTGKLGAVTIAYQTVLEKYQNRFDLQIINVLRAIVISVKLRLVAKDKSDAIYALSVLSGIPDYDVESIIDELLNEFNIINWDDNFKIFEIIGDAVPRSQFLKTLRELVANHYTQKNKERLFVSKMREWCPERIKDVGTFFAEENNITTSEWQYKAMTSSLSLIEQHINSAIDEWLHATCPDEPRGTIIYCYVSPELCTSDLKQTVKAFLKKAMRIKEIKQFPILIALIKDNDKILGNSFAEKAVIEGHFTEEDKNKYSNFIKNHESKLDFIIKGKIEVQLKERNFISCINDIDAYNLTKSCTAIFDKIYSKPIVFPFDGFSTARGNAATDCKSFIEELFNGVFDHDFYTKKEQRYKNRANCVLNSSWDVFNKQGQISRKPGQRTIRSIIDSIDKKMKINNTINLGTILNELMRPPFGANIASAGLLLAVFIGPRHDNLAIMINNQQFSISQWLSQGVFSGKFLDLNKLQNANVIYISEDVSEEWRSFLDEWEANEKYNEQEDFRIKSLQIENRIGVPPAELFYKYDSLKTKAKDATNKIKQIADQLDNALSKIHNGKEKESLGLITWGCATLAPMLRDLKANIQHWDVDEIKRHTSLYNEAKQYIQLLFPQWLQARQPQNYTIDSITEFKMKNDRICSNFKKIDFPEMALNLNEFIKKVTRVADKIIEADNFEKEVNLFLDTNTISNITSILKLEQIILNSNDYVKKLRRFQNSFKNINKNYENTINKLIELYNQATNIKKKHKHTANSIWASTSLAIKEIFPFQEKVKLIVKLYEGKETDIEDFIYIDRYLSYFTHDIKILSNDNLTWKEFYSLSEKMINEIKKDDVELPWEIDDVYNNFLEELKINRNLKSKNWVETQLAEADNINSMTTNELEQLRRSISSPPAYITESEVNDINNLNRQITILLNAAELDWLYERFTNLSTELKNKFLEKIKLQQLE